MDRRRKREADLVVIGSGLVPLMTSALAADIGMRVVHYRPTTRHSSPDHDWLHSGLLLEADVPTAMLMRVWGRNMLRRFGMRPASEPGVFLARTEEAAEALKRSAAERAVRFHELEDHEAALITGPHFSPSRSFAVPDATFDKRALSAIAHVCCLSGGVSVVDLDSSETISLLPCDTAAGGYLVQTTRELAEGAVTILADGAMIPALIEPLGIGHPLAVHRSPLISIAEPPGLRAGLLVDLDRGLSYVRHDPGGAASASYTVARTRCPADQGESISEWEPPTMRPSQAPRRKTVAVAYEVEVAEVRGQPDAVPWIHEFKREGFPGLVAAVTNVANLALWTAAQVMKIVNPPSRIDTGSG
jgi:glycine/D-amino acid oxidase-like deaminating enzyme